MLSQQISVIPVSQAAKAKPTPVIALISESCQQLLSNKATLPSMPDVAARIHSAMASPNWSISTIAAIIKGDAGTTTYLLNMANSAMYAGVEPIREVDQAISRIGLDRTRSLVMAHALRSTFETRSKILSTLMRKNWERSSRLAAVCAVLAGKCTRLSPERALLAGLLQDIGVLPILSVLNDYADQLSSEAQVQSVIDRYASQVGLVLLKHWDFEPDMLEVAKSRGKWLRNGPEPELADLVTLASLNERIVEGQAGDLPRLDELPAFAKFPLGDLLPDGSLEILEAEAETVKEVMRVLGAG